MDEAELRERTLRAGVVCGRVVHHTDKAIVAVGSRAGQLVVAKLLTTADPYWVARRAHELRVYDRFSTDPPPVRAPRLLWHDERLTVLSHVPGDRLDDDRHLTAEPAAKLVQQLLDALDQVSSWQPTSPLPAGVDYPARVAAEHDAGLIDDRDHDALHRILTVSGELVPTHGDPLPANVLFDGDSCALVDWERAGRYLPGYDYAVLYTVGAHTSRALAQAIVASAAAGGASAAFAVNAMLLYRQEIRMHRALPAGSVRTERLAALAEHGERVRYLLHRTR
ncbi:phosphotransferase [Dactylosporangium sp. NPDC050688]|uniref:phosphotransferase n=1 Tax=Dactylosporangium sp. NPDC050688 TaxID=3157217 RepID=UPI0033F8CE0C